MTNRWQLNQDVRRKQCQPLVAGNYYLSALFLFFSTLTWSGGAEHMCFTSTTAHTGDLWSMLISQRMGKLNPSLSDFLFVCRWYFTLVGLGRNKKKKVSTLHIGSHRKPGSWGV